jgi:hypothetical protein
MRRGAHGADARREHARHRSGQGLDERHVEAEASARRGDFRADEAGAYHHHAGRHLERRSDRERVLERAQGEEPGERGRARKRSRRGARRDDEAVVVEGRSTGECHAAGGRVDRLGAYAEMQVELELFEVLRLREPDLVGLAVAAQEFLRERRAVVRLLVLFPHEDEPPREAFAAQRLGAADPGE